jgi:hypothetical protein
MYSRPRHAASELGHYGQRMAVMKGHTRLLTRSWMLPVAVVAMIAGHGIVYYILRHTMLPATVVSGVIIFVVIKHLGLLSPLYALLRRRSRR